MARLGINTGTTANDGTGDNLRTGAGKINDNFTELYSALGTGTDLQVGYGKTVIGLSSTTGYVGIGTTNPTSTLTVKGNTSLETLSVSGVSTFSNTIIVGTGKSITFGDAGSNYLKLYSDGSNTYINQQNMGKLIIDASGTQRTLEITDSQASQTMAKFIGNGGAVELYHNNSKKFETLGVGVTVTGTTFTNQLSVSGVTTTATLNVGTGGTVITTTATGLVGIGTTNPTSKLHVIGDAFIGNRFSYVDAPGNLFSFPGTENDITFPGASYEIVTVGCTTDVAGSLNNTYFTIYGPVGFNTAASGIVTSIDTTLTEQNVVVWFNVAGAGSTPSVVGAGRSVGVAITTGASNVSIGNTIVSVMASDAGFTVGSSGDGTVVFVAKTPGTFSDPNAGTSGFAVTTTSNGSDSLSSGAKWEGGVLAPNGKIYGIPLNSTSVLVIDPAVGTATTFGSLSGNNNWLGGVLAPNGKIYGIPYSSTSVLVIDPAVDTATTFGSLSGTNKWVGGVLAPNGKIYGIPRNSTSVLSIGGGSAAIPDWYLSAYHNKL